MTATTKPTIVDVQRTTRAQRAALPLSADVAQALAEQHGVCIRPLAMRRIEVSTGRVEVVPVPCGSTRADQCPPCAEKARRLRMVQCREGWHLDTEPLIDKTTHSEDHKALMATRADWRASHIPDSGPNKVRPGMEGDECQNGAGNTRLNSRTKQRGWWSRPHVRSPRSLAKSM